LLVEPYLPVRGVAKRVGASTATVYALCRRGDLGHYRISNAIRIPESALAKYLAPADTSPDRETARRS
jgi:excisionase family DNA binding protein